MSQSLSKINIHLVFSTKNRVPCLDHGIQIPLWEYMGGILTRMQCQPLAVGGFDEHSHCFFNISRSLSVSQIAKELKIDSARWLRSMDGRFSEFHWQRGYAAFSVSQSNVQKVIGYISRQREHHGGGVTYERELIEMCELANVRYDPKFLFIDE